MTPGNGKGRELAQGEFTWRVTKDGHGVWVETRIPGHERWLAAVLYIGSEGQLVPAEIRVIPGSTRGRYRSATGAKPTTLTVGDRTWTFGPPMLPMGGGEWSRKPRDFAGVPRLSVRLIRQIPLDAITRKVYQLAQRSDAGSSLPKGWADIVRSEAPNVGRPRRLSDLQLATLGAAMEAKRDRRSPRLELAQELGLSSSLIRDRLQLAKARGLYEPEGHGRAGGHLTPKGRAVIAQANRRGKG